MTDTIIIFSTLFSGFLFAWSGLVALRWSLSRYHFGAAAFASALGSGLLTLATWSFWRVYTAVAS